MILQNKKSGAKSIATPEEWSMMKQKIVEHGRPNQKYSDLFIVLDENAMELPSAKTTDVKANVPTELMMHKGSGENKSDEAPADDKRSAKPKRNDQ